MLRVGDWRGRVGWGALQCRRLRLGEWCPRLSPCAEQSGLVDGRRAGGDMEGASVSANPRSVDEVFKDYRGRRAGMLKALTTGKLRPCLTLRVFA